MLVRLVFILIESYKMSIIIESMSGEKEIMLNRRISREENRKIDMDLFARLIDNPMNKFNKPKKADKELVGRGDKITAQIVRLYQDLTEFEGAFEESLVTTKMISHFAKRVVDGDILLQLQLCREPNRQGLDELVQFEMRKKYLPEWEVENLVPGHLTLADGDWKYNSAAEVASSETTKARSIDFRMTKDDLVVMDFSKFAHIAGSGQKHQINESKYFLLEVKKYLDKHDDNIYFADTLDGGFAEKFIDEHRGIIKGYESRAFVGNSKQVIEWTANLTK
jgi:hypothetical protein